MIKSYIKRTRVWRYFKNSMIFHRFVNPEFYEKQREELQFYRRILKMHPARNNIIFDVGANMGRKSFLFAKLAKKVIAFEPSQSLYHFLQKRFQDQRVTVLNCALGQEPSFLNFFIVPENQAYNSLSEKHIRTTATKRSIVRTNTLNCTQVEVETLENVIKEYGVPKYIKIDVEGYELEVLKGLVTAVPVISFEANLPEFLEESIKSLEYLDEISQGRYKYNFTATNIFLLKDFVSKEEAILLLQQTALNYVEIYALRI